MNSVKGLTHLVDSYTFGWYEPKPGQSKAIVRSNPPEDDDTNYPGGTAQFLLDGILLGSLKSKMNDWRTEGVSKTVTLKDWPIHSPELAARLEEAEKLVGQSSIPKVKVNPPIEKVFVRGSKTGVKRFNEETGRESIDFKGVPMRHSIHSITNTSHLMKMATKSDWLKSVLRPTNKKYCQSWLLLTKQEGRNTEKLT